MTPSQNECSDRAKDHQNQVGHRTGEKGNVKRAPASILPGQKNRNKTNSQSDSGKPPIEDSHDLTSRARLIN